MKNVEMNLRPILPCYRKKLPRREVMENDQTKQ